MATYQSMEWHFILSQRNALTISTVSCCRYDDLCRAFIRWMVWLDHEQEEEVVTSTEG